MAKLTSDNVRRPAAGSTNTGGSTGGGGTGGGAQGGSNGGSTGGGTGGSGNAGNTPPPVSKPVGQGASALISVASSKLGSPYVWGAKGPNSFDCSGFVYWCLNQVGVNQSYLTGDIVGVRGHVGIAAGGGTVIDASSSNGRVVHRSLSQWWANNFICAWRIF